MIIPTLYARSKQEFDKRFKELLPLAEHFQVDFMDGRFVEQTGLHIHELPDLHGFDQSFEAHLMVDNPRDWVDHLAKKGVSDIIFHVEVLNKKEVVALAHYIEEHAMHPVLAKNPHTPVEELFAFTEHIDTYQFMGVVPGVEGQAFIPEVMQDIRRFREYDKAATIAVDGGVNTEIARRLAHHGVSRLASGSYISKAADSCSALNKLKAAYSKGVEEHETIIHKSQPYDKITDYIYIGPNSCCQRERFDESLLQIGIEADLSLEEFRVDQPRGVTQYLWLPTQDHKPPSQEQLATGAAFIHNCVTQQKPVFVHCELGHTRAPTMVAAYFISQKSSVDEAIRRVKEGRPSSGITQDQRAGLEAFAKQYQ